MKLFSSDPICLFSHPPRDACDLAFHIIPPRQSGSAFCSPEMSQSERGLLLASVRCCRCQMHGTTPQKLRANQLRGIFSLVDDNALVTIKRGLHQHQHQQQPPESERTADSCDVCAAGHGMNGGCQCYCTEPLFAHKDGECHGGDHGCLCVANLGQ